jgi:hypothetical protein
MCGGVFKWRGVFGMSKEQRAMSTNDVRGFFI